MMRINKCWTLRNGKSHDLGGFDDTYENLS